MSDAREYLCVDDFVRTLIDARALRTAFELRLVDHLATSTPATVDELSAVCGADEPGVALLVNLLTANRVLEPADGAVALTPEFRRALRYRDLLETKLEYAAFVLPDFADLFTASIRDPEHFMRRSRTFQLFRYDHAWGRHPDDYERTRRWMRITTCLTKYEAPVCLQQHDVSGYERVLDIGGNSGEFALAMCRRAPSLTATVLDLPLVCEIGERHVADAPEASRITFVRGNALTDVLPGAPDLVTFKSMLHDWPEPNARRLIARAAETLRPGGTLLIFERGPVPAERLNYSVLPFLLFFRSFRSPVVYTDALASLGFHDIRTERVDLEMPFFLVTGRKP